MDEWKLVPVEPTREMMLNGSACQHHDHDDLSCIQRDMRRGIWDKMIAAAPTPLNPIACHVDESCGQGGGEVEVLAVVTLGSFSSEELGEIDVEPQMKTLERLQQQLVTSEDVSLELVDRTHVTRLQAENAALQQRLNVADQRVDELEAALKFYADKDHYHFDEPDKWDSVSGEAENLLWHEEDPAYIEDGSVARNALKVMP